MGEKSTRRTLSPRNVVKTIKLGSDIEAIVDVHCKEIIFAFNQDVSIAVSAYRDILLSFHEHMLKLAEGVKRNASS